MFNEKPVCKNHPYLCTPIIGKTEEALLEEIQKVQIKEPDIIEWRVDYFEDIEDYEKVVTVAKELKKNARGIPLLFTIRSESEGGNPTNLSQEEILSLLSYVCEDDSIEFIDYELNNPPENIKHLRHVTKKHGKSLILSYHNFSSTPQDSELLEILKNTERLGADIGKIAVMPKSHDDVLRLLHVTNLAKETLNIPIATMSMGSLGAVSRMAGWIFGSRIIFTVGEKSSAPGQVPIEELKELIHTMKKFQQ
jgi:3-dehydroquinate dehydratase I